MGQNQSADHENIAVKQFYNLDRYSQEELIECLSHADVYMRSEAIHYLVDQDVESPSVIDAIIQRVDDNSDMVRIKAILGLAGFGKYTDTIEPVLVRICMDKQELPKMRGVALQSLVQLHEQSPHLRSVIYQFLDDENSYVVRAGIEQMVHLDVSDEEKLKLVTYGLNHEEIQCRLESLCVLQASPVDPYPLLYRIIELLYFYNDEIKAVALELLTRIGSKAKEAFASVIALYHHEQGPLKILALKALTSIDLFDDRLKVIIKEALHSQNLDCRDIALDAVASLGEVGIMFEKDVDSLKHDEHPGLRSKAEQLKFKP